MKFRGMFQQQEGSTFFDRILGFASVLGMGMILFAMLSLCAHVVMRYIFGKPLNWTLDVSSIFLLYITLLAAAWLQKLEGHVSLDFLFLFLKPKSQLKLEIFNSILCSIAFLIMIWFGIKETITVYRMDLYEDMPLGPPEWILMVVIPIGCLMILIQFMRRIRGLMNKLKNVDQKTKQHPASI